MRRELRVQITAGKHGRMISEPFIRRPIATSLLALGLVLAGLFAYAALPIASLPRADIPTIVVWGGEPGADPVTTATALTAPLERRLAGFAHHRHVLDFPAHHDRLAPPVPRHAQPLAWRLRRRLVLVGLVLGRAARRGGVLVGATVTPLAHRTRAASLIAPVGIVARRRSRTGRRVLAQPIGQRPHQFAEPPRQIFKLLPRQTRT